VLATPVLIANGTFFVSFSSASSSNTLSIWGNAGASPFYTASSQPTPPADASVLSSNPAQWQLTLFALVQEAPKPGYTTPAPQGWPIPSSHGWPIWALVIIVILIILILILLIAMLVYLICNCCACCEQRAYVLEM